MWLYYLWRDAMEMEGIAKNVDEKLYKALEEPKQSVNTGSINVPEIKKRR